MKNKWVWKRLRGPYIEVQIFETRDNSSQFTYLDQNKNLVDTSAFIKNDEGKILEKQIPGEI